MTSLRTKLTALLAAPLIVLVVVAGAGVRSATARQTRAGDVADRIDLALSAQDAGLALVQERRLAATEPGSSGLEAQREQTDEAIDVLDARLAGAGGAGLADLDVTAATDAMGELGSVREAVDAEAPAEEVLQGYSEIVEPVMALDAGLPDAGLPDVYRRLQAQRGLVRLTDEAAREESLIHGALAAATVTAATADGLRATLTEQDIWSERFREAAPGPLVDAYTEMGSVPSVTTAEQLRDRILLDAPETPEDASTTAWTTSMDKKIDLLVALVDRSADGLEEQVDRARTAAGTGALRAYGLLAAALGGVALLVLALRRLAVRPLQDLASSTQEAADELVAATSDGPIDRGDGMRRSIPLPADDELSDIADAFNSVQSAAVALSAEQTVTRDDAHQVFVNFGRRAQNLVTRQLGQIDDLEARTDDPDVLSDLFMLDHLSTRLRRNAESMVVLAGAESPRPWARPVSVVNVVRAAAAEATDYSRVDVASIAPGAVAGATANDVSHLLAELIDNALTYSPPGSRVYVAGEAQAEGRYLVAVADAGLGMSPSQLAEANARLGARGPGHGRTGEGAAGPDGTGDVPLAKYFGLYVVSQLARRHDIEVRLVSSRHNGIQAEVCLPRSIMVLPGGFHAPELPARPVGPDGPHEGAPSGEEGAGTPGEPAAAGGPTRPNLVTPPGLVPTATAGAGTGGTDSSRAAGAGAHTPPGAGPPTGPAPDPPPPPAAPWPASRAGAGSRLPAGSTAPGTGGPVWPPSLDTPPPVPTPPVSGRTPATPPPGAPPVHPGDSGPGLAGQADEAGSPMASTPPPGNPRLGPPGDEPGTAGRDVRRRTLRPRGERGSAEHPVPADLHHPDPPPSAGEQGRAPYDPSVPHEPYDEHEGHDDGR